MGVMRWTSVASYRRVAPLSLLIVTALGTSLSSAATTSGPTVVSTGLNNLGNTCYLNSQLQCAYHIPRVRSLILGSAAHSDSIEDENVGIVKHKEETVALQALRIVFRSMDEAAGNGVGPISPSVLCQSLGIPVNEQQDTQEFWKLLLPALQMPTLTDLYQGAFEDYIVALDGSGREKRREEPFLDLSLDVSQGSVLSSLKEVFGKPELLSEAEGNGWRPEKGAEKVNAHKGSLLKVQGLPCILQLHLKRFNYDWNTDSTTKLNDPFSFPEVLDLSSFCDDITRDDEERTIYDLQSVLIHIGQYGSGHYYVYVRPDVREDDWYRFNDHVVTPVEFEEVLADSFGGATSVAPQSNNTGFFSRMRRSLFGSSSYGFGGQTSNAYVVQYVRRADIPILFDDEK
jgi:ubiquitin carboxyl-terminal hydrolase 7